MIEALMQPVRNLSEYEKIMKDLSRGATPIEIDGCTDTQKCHLMAALGDGCRSRLIVTYDEMKARELYEDYLFFDKKVWLYPAKDVIFFSADIHSSEILSRRLEVIRRLIDGENITVITTIDGLMDRILPPEMMAEQVLTFRTGDIVPLDIIRRKLVAMGFEFSAQVETPGQFSIRGGILDVYNMTDPCPYRIELWDDEIDTIKSFDAESQRSIDQADRICIYPAAEFVMDEARQDRGLNLIRKEVKNQTKRLADAGEREAAQTLKRTFGELDERIKYGRNNVNIDSLVNYFYEETVSFLDYFSGEGQMVFIDEPQRVGERLETFAAEFGESMNHRLTKGYILPGQAKSLVDPMKLAGHIARLKTVLLSALGSGASAFHTKAKYSVRVNGMRSYLGNFELLVKDLTRWKQKKYRMIIVCHSNIRGKRLAADLEERGLPAFYSEDENRSLMAGEIMVIKGDLHRGIEYPLSGYVIIAQTDIFGQEKKKRKTTSKTKAANRIRGFDELSIGDYVVHENQGIGIYRGIERIEIDGTARDYIKIEYAGGSNFFILATNLDLLQKYADKEAEHVKVGKLGSPEWHKTKSRVRSAVRELAMDLVELYAKRQQEHGFVCGPDTSWQREFEDMFPFEETGDQLEAVAAIKRDMESPKIMDRLICGDVGFGKTEVAIRAAFKMVQESRQVAVLVPTTILAQQHYNTFAQRMTGYPVNIGLLSRFRTPTQIKQTLADLKAGRLDIVIGTHRLLSKDVVFKDLGLLVVDEEQRFGVSHKEKIKKLKENVDVLTLSATPIPRTMHMGLIGIRDMSLLEEAPVDRMPVQTYVMEYNEEMVREAIVRELARGGQIYYVYNRVNGIDAITARIQEMVPQAVVRFAHGQMSERQLEQIMYGFVDGEIDVLVSTTIIETGLDIPNVNTIIIHDAEKMGLSQLYQLKGRVGRSDRMAYAFLLYKRDKVLKEVAEKRLSAIREFTELGSGYRIAMRDLEIRGAGSLLGEYQSGHMEAVGYDLYCKMLRSAVLEAKGEPEVPDFDTTIDMEIDAYIPAAYIANEFQKLDMYKRIASIQNEEEYGEILDEMIDRYGNLPKPAMNLLEIALMRTKLHRIYVINLVHREKEVKIYLHEHALIRVEGIAKLAEYYGRRMKFISKGDNPYFVVDMKGLAGQKLLAEIVSMTNLMCEELTLRDTPSET